MKTLFSDSTPVKILIDEMPLTLIPQSVSDYSAYQITSLTTLPLTRVENQSVKPLAAESWERSEDGLQYRFKLRNGLQWSDGSPIQSADYVRSIEYLRRNKSARFARLLSDLEPSADSVYSNNNDIVFQLRQSNYFFPEILSMVPFSPMNSQNQTLGSGAYYIFNIEDNLVRLKRNQFFKSDDSRQVETLEFHKIIGCENAGIDKVLLGEFDRSCDTAFPYKKYSKLQSQTIKKSLQMAMVLSYGSKKNEIPQSIYELLFDSINKKFISEGLHGVLNPLQSYMDLFKVSPNICDLPHTYSSHFESTRIEIAYENYFPNLEVLEHIKIQAKEKNLIVETVQENYGSRLAQTHLRLEVRQSPIPSPFLYFRSEISQKCYSDKSDEIAVTAKKLFSNYQTSGDEKYLLELNSIISKRRASYPLFEIPGLYIQSSRMSPINDFQPGQVWSFKC